MMRKVKVGRVVRVRRRFVESRQNVGGFRKFLTARVARER